MHVFKQNLTLKNLKGVYYTSACRTEQPLAADGELLTGIYSKYSNGRFKQMNKQNCFCLADCFISFIHLGTYSH